MTVISQLLSETVLSGNMLNYFTFNAIISEERINSCQKKNSMNKKIDVLL